MSRRKDYNIPTPLRVSNFLFRSQFSLTHIRKNGRCTISSEQNCTTFYKFLKSRRMIRRKLTQHNFLGKLRYYDWMQIILKKHKQMARRLGRQIGDRRDNFSRQSFFLLAMATKTVAAWSAAYMKHQPVKQGHTTTPGTPCPTLCRRRDQRFIVLIRED